jgi:oxygen-independent coproporphyrinogen-3 oxidase
MTNLDVNLDLVKKYDVPGPRYTSYPSALHFSEEIRQEDIIEQIKRNNETNKPISLYFHLPFCYSLCWFCGCTQVITKNQDKGPVYMDYLDKEMKQMAPYINDGRDTVQMPHFSAA